MQIVIIIAILCLLVLFLSQRDLLIKVHAASIPFFIVIPGVTDYYVTPLFVLTGLILITEFLVRSVKVNDYAEKTRLPPSIKLFLFAIILTFAFNPSNHALIAVTPRVMIIVSGFTIGNYLVRSSKVSEYFEIFTYSTSILGIASIVGLTSYLKMNKNHLGLIFAIAIICSIHFIESKLNKVLIIMALTVSLVNTGSRSAMLGLAICMLLKLLFRGNYFSIRKLIYSMLLILASWTIFATVNFPFKQRLFEFTPDLNTSGGYSIFARLQIYKQAWDQFNQHRIFGNGLGGLVLDNFYKTQDAHNLFLQALGEGGIVLGLSTFLLVASPIRYFLKPSFLINRNQVITFYLWILVLVHGFVDVFWVMGRTNLFWIAFGVLTSQTNVFKIRKMT